MRDYNKLKISVFFLSVHKPMDANEHMVKPLKVMLRNVKSTKADLKGFVIVSREN